MKLFDTHAHLTHERFDADRREMIAALPGAGVELVMEIACDLRELAPSLALADEHPFIYIAAGMHPHEVQHMTNALMDELARALKLPKVLALGEIGLDYHYDFSPRDVQRKWFGAQLELAMQHNMPVALHVREAFGDTMDILRANRKGIKGVMHCFSGSVEIAKECVDMGLYIAFGGSLTFKNARRTVEAAASLPMERIVIETDCPYLTPEPHRGERNSPAFVGFVATRLAEIRSMDPDEVAAITLENGKRLFEMA